MGARVSAHNCSRSPVPESCSYLSDFRYKIVDDITIDTIKGSSSSACCTACRGNVACAVFVLTSDKTCTLLSANQGGDAEKGTLSGSPTGGLRTFSFMV